MPVPLYNGDASKYPISISEVDDSSPPNAAVWNIGTQGLADRTAYVNGFLVPRATEWPHLTTPATKIYTATYDAKFGRWLVAGTFTGVGWRPAVSHDGGFSFAFLGGSLATVDATPVNLIAAADTLGDVVIVQSTGVTSKGQYWTAGGGTPDTWTVDNTWGLNSTSAAAVWFTGAGLFVGVGFGAVNAARSRLIGAASPWAPRALPAPIATAAGAANLPPLLAQSPTRLVVGYPGPNTQSFLASTDDGNTWTDRSVAGITADVLVGLSYDTTAGLFVALTSGASQRIWTSPDAITWTVQSTTIPGTYNPTGLACSGRCWVIPCSVGPGGSTMTQLAIFSVDGGITWRHATGYNMPVAVGGVGILADRVYAGATQFLAVNATQTLGSLVQGLPPPI